MPTLPNFTSAGVLPPGDYAMTLEDLEESILVLGPSAPKNHPTWDAAWRLRLEPTAALRSFKCRCGTPTASSYTRTAQGCSPGVTATATPLNFQHGSVSEGPTAKPKALSRSLCD